MNQTDQPKCMQDSSPATAGHLRSKDRVAYSTAIFSLPKAVGLRKVNDRRVFVNPLMVDLEKSVSLCCGNSWSAMYKMVGGVTETKLVRYGISLLVLVVGNCMC